MKIALVLEKDMYILRSGFSDYRGKKLDQPGIPYCSIFLKTRVHFQLQCSSVSYDFVGFALTSGDSTKLLVDLIQNNKLFHRIATSWETVCAIVLFKGISVVGLLDYLTCFRDKTVSPLGTS